MRHADDNELLEALDKFYIPTLGPPAWWNVEQFDPYVHYADQEVTDD